jgi:pimeloyl-ACP methyl ester carboxylesterase/ketosteroid isomerase-like protein
VVKRCSDNRQLKRNWFECEINMLNKSVSTILTVAMAFFIVPAVAPAQDASARRTPPADVAHPDVHKIKETQMTPSIINGPQGTLVAFRTNSGKAKGLPLVFVHADPGRATQWEAVMTLMAKTHEMTAFDFRGSGASAPPADGDYSYAGRAADIAAVVDTFHIKRFVIVAHSAGAAVALAYAAANNAKVAGIVLVDPATDPRAVPAEVRDGFIKSMTGPDSAKAFTTYVESIAGPTPKVRKQVIADAKKLNAEGRAGVAKATGSWNPEIALNAYKGPMFILSTPATDNDGALYRLVPGIPHQVVPTKGHWIQLDHPALVQKAIEKFISKLDTKLSEIAPLKHDSALEPEDLARFFVLRANSGDVAGLVALYEPDAALALPDGKVAKGAEAIRRFYTAMLSKQPKLVAAKQSPALLNGDLALTSSRLANGTVTAEVARRQPDGSWLWAVDQPAVSGRPA